MSGVFQNIDPPPPTPPGERVPPRLWSGGRTHSLGGEEGGGSIFWKTPDTGLYSTYDVSTLWIVWTTWKSKTTAQIIRGYTHVQLFIWLFDVNQRVRNKGIFCAHPPAEKGYFTVVSPYLWTSKQPRNRFQGIDSASLCNLAQAGTSNMVFVPGPPGWESIPGLLKKFTNSDSGCGNRSNRPPPSCYTQVDVCCVSFCPKNWCLRR